MVMYMEGFKVKFYEIIMALVYISIGVLMLANPKFVCDAVNYIIGIIIVVFGLIYLFKLLQNKNVKELSKLELLIGLLCMGFGLYLILNSSLLISILPICAGIIILLDAISQINKSFKLKKVGSKFWYINLIVGLIFFAFSLFIILKASEVTYLIVRIIGGVLVIDGLFEFYTYFKLREYNNSVKVIEAKEVLVKEEN